MTAAYPEPLPEPSPAVSNSQHADSEAIQAENKRLRELVVQLSKLVVKHILHEN